MPRAKAAPRAEAGADAVPAEPTVADAGARPAGRPAATRRSPRAPRWAWLCTISGALLMLFSGGVLVGSEVLLARYQGAVAQGDLFGDEALGATPPPKRSSIQGPLNLLLVGIDPRQGQENEPPRSDSVMVMHVTEGLDRAYLFSMPRDLVVDIPAFPKAGFGGSTEKLNAAMAYGSRVPGQVRPDPVRGFELLALTVSNYTGIKRFDAGAIINFSGFQKIVDAIGGVDMYIDTDVKSEHRRPDGSYREGKKWGEGYVGPQATYTVGPAHLKGWQALDYVRQRYGLPNGDYDRQRHQQQFVKAMVEQAFSRDVVTNPLKLDSVLRAAGESLIFNGRGSSVADFGFALRNLRSESIEMVRFPGGGIGVGANYRGEALEPVAKQFFAAMLAGTADDFLAGHPELVNKDK
ncbi:LCP family protein [Micromonospora zhanjiangensis]|uniref:LCP family protein n=1 Tax=Micromonospora zhanjiangensis TaxID=1522057 RepID=A0ABV8KSR6_9ACTN